MDENEKFTITVKGPGIDITKKISSTQLAKIIPTILSQESALSVAEARQPITQVSVREYLNENQPKTNPQKIAVFAMFLRDIQDYKVVSTDDIKTQFEKASEPLPKNFTRDFKDVLRSGWLAESHEEPGRYFITASGEKAISTKFSQRGTKTPISKSKKKKTQFSPTKIRPQISGIDLEPNISGFKNYWDITTKGDRILWLLAQAKSKGIEDVNYKELSELAVKVGDNIPSGSITALIETHKKKGRIIAPFKGDNKILKILEPGIEYIKKV